MRLAKYIAHAGVASRRAAEVMIEAGRVRVEGQIVRDPARAVEQGTDVSVDGRSLSGPERRVVYALHKPVGVLSTASDPFGRQTVLDLFGPSELRLYPVGRLDADSSGLILLTNDGELANRLTHPRYELARTYHARVAGGHVPERTLARLRDGVLLEDGPTGPAVIRRLKAHSASSELLELTIREGRNRQVRRMFEAVAHPVLELKRVSFGSLRLGGLASGERRRLSERELDQLREPPGVPAAAGLGESRA